MSEPPDYATAFMGKAREALDLADVARFVEAVEELLVSHT